MINSPIIVDAAFNSLLAALEAEVAELEKIGGEVFHDCSPKQARGLLRTAKDTAVLKEHIVHLYHEWKSGGPLKLSEPPAPKSPRSKQEPLNPVLIRHMKGVSITDAAITTTYYLRSLGASNIEKATISVKKETRGAVKEGTDGGQNSGDSGGSHQAIAAVAAPEPAPAKKTYTAEEKTACSIEAMRNGEACEACQ